MIPASLSTSTLRQLGYALLARAQASEEVERAGRLQLDEAGIDRLAEILLSGSRPTIGFWRRYGKRDA